MFFIEHKKQTSLVQGEKVCFFLNLTTCISPISSNNLRQMFPVAVNKVCTTLRSMVELFRHAIMFQSINISDVPCVHCPL